MKRGEVRLRRESIYISRRTEPPTPVWRCSLIAAEQEAETRMRQVDVHVKCKFQKAYLNENLESGSGKRLLHSQPQAPRHAEKLILQQTAELDLPINHLS